MILGTKRVRVGATWVRTVEERQVTTITGSQQGKVTEDWWFSDSSGLPVHMTRQMTINSSSPVGTVTYTESGQWTMTSLTPRRPAQ